MHNHFHSNPDLRPAGERFFVRSEAGEDVPLRRIRLCLLYTSDAADD